MGRIINLETAGKERTRLTKAIVLAIRELSKQSQPDETTRDLAAFIAIGLATIAKTIDLSVEAWEKRGFWVKADKFRMEWIWTGRFSEMMEKALMSEDWLAVAQISVQVAGRLPNVQVSNNHRLGSPWAGVYRKMKAGDVKLDT